MENLDLLTNGDEGDNQKLMFKTVKRGDKLDLSKPNLSENDLVAKYAERGLYDRDGAKGAEFSLKYNFKWVQDDKKDDDGFAVGVVLMPEVGGGNV